MARTSDTRTRVRELAASYLARGVTPTSRQIRDDLGKGSLSTITEELKTYFDERSYSQKGNVGAVVANQPGIATHGLRPQEALGAFDQSSRGAPAADADNVLESLPQALKSISEEIAETRKTYTEQLALAYTRYESVQRQAMLQIDSARHEASELRAKLASFSMDAQMREDALRGKANMLTEQNAVLRGKVEALERLLDKLKPSDS
jgi:signal transduction histidine kinase